MIRELQPDIAVLDVDMPGMNGLEVARTVQKENLPTDIIVLTMYREEDMFNSAMDLGVRGYVLKDNAVTDIVACINAVAEGTYYLSPRISEYLVGRSERARALLKKRPELDTLTPTEKRVLSLIAEEKTSKEIAEEMHVALKTVENHRSNISGKLNLRGSHSLLKFAIGHKSFLN
jgi:DNA-binding NarL/FixJ family response regulator